MKDSKIDKYQIGKVVTIIVITLFVIWLVAQVLGSCNYGEKINNSDNLTILLSFIGVMATFIVINNISQVNEIRNQMKESLDREKEVMKEALLRNKEENDSRIDKMLQFNNEQITNIQRDNRILRRSINTQLRTQRRQYEQIEQDVIYNVISYLLNNQPLNDLVDKIMPLDSNVTFSFTLLDGEVISNGKIGMEEGQLQYYRDGNRISNEKITKIDNVEVNTNTLNYLYKLYVRNYKGQDVKEGINDISLLSINKYSSEASGFYS